MWPLSPNLATSAWTGWPLFLKCPIAAWPGAPIGTFGKRRSEPSWSPWSTSNTSSPLACTGALSPYQTGSVSRRRSRPLRRQPCPATSAMGGDCFCPLCPARPPIAPRILDLGDQRLFHLGRSLTYHYLDPLLTRTINRDRIIQHWGDLLGIAGSLKLGWVPPLCS